VPGARLAARMPGFSHAELEDLVAADSHRVLR
jgi:hypothetical protein